MAAQGKSFPTIFMLYYGQDMAANQVRQWRQDVTEIRVGG